MFILYLDKERALTKRIDKIKKWCFQCSAWHV